MLGTMLDRVRNQCPLIHNITNYVTVNDCANILLACGASPIMADDPGEAEDITSICGGLVINIGTLNARTIPAMFAAGKKAVSLGHPVVLDPVGAGASALRTNTALELMEGIRFSAIRGNISEIKALALHNAAARGVDADEADKITENNLEGTIAFARDFSRKTGAVISISGAVDIVTDENRTYCIKNGHPDMSRITGTGCQLSAMTAAFLTANPDHPLDAAAAAVCAMGLCGETAHARLTGQDGNMAYRGYIIDAIYHLTGDDLERGAKYEIR